MSVTNLRKIGALIREQRHILLARWRREVRTLPSAKGLDAPTLNDHMPYLIDELAEALENQPDNIEDELLRGSPPAHGRQRLRDGFNVEEVVAEYNVLRGCIHDLAEEHGMVIHGSDLRVINRIIDEAIGLAVQSYATLLSLEIKKHRDLHLNFVAHDLRTPLQAIALTVGIIERTLTESVKSEQTDQLLKILRRNIQQLEKSVVEVIKANSDSPADATEKLERREIDVWPIVEAVIRGLVPVAAPAGVELVNEVHVDLSAFADGALLARIFENLISYGINSAPRGAVRVIGRDLGQSGTECQVVHNGPGATTESLRKMFERGADKTEVEGIGLGLPIVKQSIEAHGGELEVEADEQIGVAIRFRLPARSR